VPLVPSFTSRFKKDVKQAERRGKDMARLRSVLSLLIDESPLPPGLLDHPLKGNWRGHRELHIEPDWLLIYKVEGRGLWLARTGSHSDLFAL
jgi:mRNA interferase YafQ